jgi:hypothetical protein
MIADQEWVSRNKHGFIFLYFARVRQGKGKALKVQWRISVFAVVWKICNP